MNFPLTYIYCENLRVNQPLKVSVEWQSHSQEWRC